ncbi:MAG: phosphatase PAP2-related protein, partial [Patescibacteria group bacterium]
MKSLINKHKIVWADKLFVISSIIAFLAFSASLFVNYGAILFSTKEMGSATTDILLEYLPIINTDIIFSEGALLFVIFVAILLILQPRTIPFILKSVALFICIRSIFVIMTHLALPLGSIATDLGNFGYVSSGADLFFSGHTGLPFLMALMFWENKYLKRIFLFCSVVAAGAVILGHLHYTIDVFAAFFITYVIYHIAQIFFQKDYKIFMYV